MVKLAWYEDGKDFEPIVFEEDLAEVTKAEKENRGDVPKVVEAHRMFLQKVLARNDTGKKHDKKLTVKQIQSAYFAIIGDVLSGEAPGPLV